MTTALGSIKELLDTLFSTFKSFGLALKNGQISEAKRFRDSIGRQLGSLSSFITNNREALQPSGLFPNLTVFSGHIFNSINGLDSKLNLDSYSDAECQKDIKSWREILTELEVHSIIGNIFSDISSLRTLIENKIVEFEAIPKPDSTESLFPPNCKVAYSSKFERFLKSADPDFKNAIERVIETIRIRPLTSKFHEPVTTGEYSGKSPMRRHSYLPAPWDNFRIIFYYTGKSNILFFEDIGTHKELGLSE